MTTRAMTLATAAALAALGPVCWSAPAAQAATYVLGDSLGAGVVQAVQTKGHIKGLARIGIHIRGPKALAQFAQTPDGATVFLALGTNDAEGSIARLDKSIEDIVQAAEKKDITLIWLGPPCVRKSWDSRARELDAMLCRQLSSTAVSYVSMRDEELCSGSLHEPDGVHLKIKGYVHMWERARLAAWLVRASAESAADVTGAIAASATAAKRPRPKLMCSTTATGRLD
jgi:lysophospholipase L1-like esterase